VKPVTAFAAAFFMFLALRGSGRLDSSSARPVQLVKAWADKSLFVWAILVISFVVFAIRSVFRRW